MAAALLAPFDRWTCPWSACPRFSLRDVGLVITPGLSVSTALRSFGCCSSRRPLSLSGPRHGGAPSRRTGARPELVCSPLSPPSIRGFGLTDLSVLFCTAATYPFVEGVVRNLGATSSAASSRTWSSRSTHPRATPSLVDVRAAANARHVCTCRCFVTQAPVRVPAAGRARRVAAAPAVRRPGDERSGADVILPLSLGTAGTFPRSRVLDRDLLASVVYLAPWRWF